MDLNNSDAYRTGAFPSTPKRGIWRSDVLVIKAAIIPQIPSVHQTPWILAENTMLMHHYDLVFNDRYRRKNMHLWMELVPGRVWPNPHGNLLRAPGHRENQRPPQSRRNHQANNARIKQRPTLLPTLETSCVMTKAFGLMPGEPELVDGGKPAITEKHDREPPMSITATPQ